MSCYFSFLSYFFIHIHILYILIFFGVFFFRFLSFCPSILPLLSRHTFPFGLRIRIRKKSGWRRCFWHWMFIVAFVFIWLFLLDVSKYHKPLLFLRGHHINDRMHSVELEMCFICEWLMKTFFYIIHTYTHSLTHSLCIPTDFKRLKCTRLFRLTLQMISVQKGEQGILFCHHNDRTIPITNNWMRQSTFSH